MYKINLYILYQYLVARSSIITNRIKSRRSLVSAVCRAAKSRRPTFQYRYGLFRIKYVIL